MHTPDPCPSLWVYRIFRECGPRLAFIFPEFARRDDRGRCALSAVWYPARAGRHYNVIILAGGSGTWRMPCRRPAGCLDGRKLRKIVRRKLCVGAAANSNCERLQARVSGHWSRSSLSITPPLLSLFPPLYGIRPLQPTFLPARRYASAGLCDSDVSVRPSVCHTPVLCVAERKQDREMYTI